MSEEDKPYVPEEQIVVESVQEFGQLIQGWHASKMFDLARFIKIPDGTEMKFQEKDQPLITVVMTGELRQGFIYGIHVALMQLGTLPFGQYEEKPNDAANDEPTPATTH